MRRGGRRGWGIRTLPALALAGCGLGLSGTGESDAGLPDRIDAAIDAAADAPEVEAGSPTAVVASAVSGLSLRSDYARPGDGAIGTDGVKDGVFEVTVTGPARALALILTDASGAASGGQEWDTWVGQDAIPAAVGTPFVQGASTYQLAVLENGVVINDAAGRLSLAPGSHALWIAGASVGSFTTGSHFRVLAQSPDGTIVRGPVVTY